jgi:catechol 2,3-dioxygenase-like lactoylglutathione lyase family enzyme
VTATAAEVGRVQLALNVSDLEAAIDFYSKLFQTAPAKRHTGYANFAVADPPLKLVLFENPANAGTLNHLGVEVGTADEVVRATKRLAAEGLSTEVEDGVTCCHALQDKVWVTGADTRWEVYTVLADDPVDDAAGAPGGCCATSSSEGANGICCATLSVASEETPTPPDRLTA